MCTLRDDNDVLLLLLLLLHHIMSCACTSRDCQRPFHPPTFWVLCVADGKFTSCVGCPDGAQANGNIFITLTDKPVLVDRAGNPVGVQNPEDLRQFRFDHVFGQATQTADLYATACRKSIASVLKGVNATIFAYGQTGTGKTHTMMGDERESGIATLLAADLLQAAADLKDVDDVEVHISYLQVYRRTVTDLLGDTSKNLRVRAGAAGIEVEGLSQTLVRTPKDLLRFVDIGTRNRRTDHS